MAVIAIEYRHVLKLYILHLNDICLDAIINKFRNKRCHNNDNFRQLLLTLFLETLFVSAIFS